MELCASRWSSAKALIGFLVVFVSFSTVHGVSKLDKNEFGYTLFSQGDNALSWDHYEIEALKNSEGKDLSNEKLFLEAESVGAFLRYEPIEAMHMPVPVNVVFVGFANDGNMHVNISTETMQEWFGHLDHVLPHARVELAELNCAEDGACTGLVHGRIAPKPVPSYVHLNFSCNVIVTGRVGVMRTFERALHAFSRPVDPEIAMGAQQVDAAKMEAFIDSFLTHMGLTERGYTLLVLNPTWSVSEPVYGYRLGMSQKEMDLLLNDVGKVKAFMAKHQRPEPVIPSTTTNGWFHKSSRDQHTKFAAVDMSEYSDMWIGAMDKYLTAVEDYRKAMLKEVGSVTGAAAIVQAATLMQRPACPIGQVLREELLFPDPYTSVYSKFRTMHPAEDCMVGNWVGHQRWVMLDLTASGFDWGPALGGEGVVHRHSIPSVVDHFTQLQHLKERHIEQTKTEADRKLDEALELRTSSHKSDMINNAYKAFAAEMAAKNTPPAPGEAPKVLTQEEKEANANQWKNKYQETLVKAELDVFQEFSDRHCKGAAQSARLCTQIKEEAAKARSMLAKMASSKAMTIDVWRDLNWDVFGHEANLELESKHISYAAQSARDLFMAQLNSVLSSALRHVVAPPSATWTHAGGYLHDTATPFASDITFHIYLIKDAQHANPEVVHTSVSFDLEAFKDQVQSLMLPGQNFHFKLTRIGLQEDHLLATAVATAQRVSAQEIPSDTDMVQEAERVYLDTATLSHVLRQRFTSNHHRKKADVHSMPSSHLPGNRQDRLAELDGEPLEEEGEPDHLKEGSHEHSHYDLPVFIFEVHREYAMMLDEHYNARSLEDMIIITQNAARDDEHPVGMMCGGALVARPLSPLREALSAVLSHLGGVLPPHLGYNAQRHKVTHDWLWSVGAHPHSLTSVGTRYTDMQRDALGRSYILDGVDSSIDLVNDAIRKLKKTNTNKAVLEHMKKHEIYLTEMHHIWNMLIDDWRHVMDACWQLNWGTAVHFLPIIEDQALRFHKLSEMLTAVPNGAVCQNLISSKSEVYVFPTLVASLVIASGALVWLLWPAVFNRNKDNAKYRIRV